jgi:hypothetical protein
LYNTGDEIRKMWLEPCRQSSVKMHADKEHFETEEIKTKAQILPFPEKKGMMMVVSINSFFFCKNGIVESLFH